MPTPAWFSRVRVVFRAHRAVFLVVLLVCCFSVFLQLSPGFLDPDSFYHARMAALLREGVSPRAFTWLPETGFASDFADHHFLYHALLVPLLAFVSPLLAAKIFVVFATTLVFFVLAYYLIRFRVPFGWLLLLCASASSLFFERMALAKANSLALVLFLLFFLALAAGRFLPLFSLAFLATWTHGSWPVLLVAVALWLLAGLVSEQGEQGSVFSRALGVLRRDWRVVAYPVLGIFAALLLHPAFPSNLSFYARLFLDIVLLERHEDIAVGNEWRGLSLIGLMKTFAPFLLPVLLATIGLWRTRSVFVALPSDPIRTRRLWFFFFLSVVFFGMTLRAVRQVEYFVPFFTLLLAFAFERFLSPQAEAACFTFLRGFFSRSLAERIALSLVATASGFLFFVSMLFVVLDVRKSEWPLATYSGAAAYLAEHVPTHDLIFNVRWDAFPPLWYWHPSGRYLWGLDPRYLLPKHPDLAARLLRKDVRAEELRAFAEEVGSETIVLQTSGIEAPLVARLRDDPAHFRVQYQDAHVVIFRVLSEK